MTNPPDKHKDPGWFKLFDVRGQGIYGEPTGIAYMETENRFVMNDMAQVDRLFIVDEKGRNRGTRTIRYLGNYMPEHVEAIAYVPPSSPIFPDHLVMATTQFGPPLESRVQVLQRDGQAVAEIFPAIPPGDDGFIGLGFLSPDRLLISRAENEIWVIDFNGNVVDGPVVLPGQFDLEGLLQLPDGRVVAADIYAGTLFFFDKSLNRLPGDDQDYTFGLGISKWRGLAWNTDTDQHMITHIAAAADPIPWVVSAVSPLLDAASRVIDLGSAGFYRPQAMTYLPDEHRTAVAHFRTPQAILLFDDSGALAEQIDLSAVGRPQAIEYIPKTHEFAVTISGDPLTLHILARDGAPVRTVDLSPTGIQELRALASFEPDPASEGRFLIAGWPDRMLITDMYGKLLDAFNWRKKLDLTWPRPVDVSAITTGPQAGAFAMIAGTNEIVVFRWDSDEGPDK